MQVSLLAQELAKDKEFKVSILQGNYGQPTVIKRGRLSLYKTRIFDFFNLLKKINADIYIERTINPKIFLVYIFCRIFQKKFIYMVAHDWDLSHRIINFADLIITQHSKQKTAKGFHHNIILPPLIRIDTMKSNSRRKYIIWIGRADYWKKPLDFINLAKANPQERFIMVCRQGSNINLFNQLQKKASHLSNIKFLSGTPFFEINSFFLQSKLLVNTSIAEGFPNTFLQAGAARVPVLSFKVNPDNYIIKYHCGQIGSKQFKKILNNPDKLRIMGQNHYQYVKKHHSLENINIFKQCLFNLTQ